MTARYAEIAFSEPAKALQETAGSRRSYDKMAASSSGEADVLSEREAEFVAARDSFYLATTTPDGWPYVQHRGGPVGFLRVTGDRQLAFPDFSGNKQYITAGNIDADDRVSLFLMDYPNKRRLKVLGRMKSVTAEEDSRLIESLADPAYDADIERAMVIEVEAFDWNCPSHITERFTKADIEPTFQNLIARIRELEEQVELLKYTKPGAAPDA